MSDAQDELVRRYRRWLSWYPGWFRRDNEAEMLTVLLEGAEPGQRRPAAADRLDLLVGGLLVRLRPRIPRSDRPAWVSIWLMYAGAATELAVLVTVLATQGEVREAIVAHHPEVTDAQLQADLSATMEPLAIAAGISVLLWLWLAWAHGRRHHWATALFVLFFIANTRSFLHGLTHGSVTYAPRDVAAGLVLWLLEAVIVGFLAWAWTQRVRAKRQGQRGDARSGSAGTTIES